jgi:hypothetical protein
MQQSHSLYLSCSAGQEPNGLLSVSQESATGPHSKSDTSKPQPRVCFFNKLKLCLLRDHQSAGSYTTPHLTLLQPSGKQVGPQPALTFSNSALCSNSVFRCFVKNKNYFSKTLPNFVVSTPGSYSGGPGFKSRLGTGYPDLCFSRFSSVPPCKCRNSTLKLGHDRFYPHPSLISPSFYTL